MQVIWYLQIIWKWLWLIVLCALVAGGTSYAVSKYALSPVYRASTFLIVTVSAATDEAAAIDSNNTYDTFLANEYMTATFKELIKKRPIMEVVAQTLDMDPGQLHDRVEIDIIPKTSIIKLSFSDGDPVAATTIVNRIATVFQEVSYERGWLPGRELAVIEPANVPESPVSPQVFLNTLIAAIVGGIASLAIVFLYEYLTLASSTQGRSTGLENRDRAAQTP